MVTSAMLRTCAVRLPAIWLTDSVSSFQTPDTPLTCAWPPSFPSVPTSRATRVTSEVNTESWSIILLTSFAERRNSPSSGRPSTSRAIDCPRSPFATAPTARVTSVVGQTRSSINMLIAATSSAHPPTTPGTLMRCLSLPSLPTVRETRAVSRARRSLTAAMSLKASAILPSTPVRSDASRTAKLPSRSASIAASSSRENGPEPTMAVPSAAPGDPLPGMVSSEDDGYGDSMKRSCSGLRYTPHRRRPFKIATAKLGNQLWRQPDSKKTARSALQHLRESLDDVLERGRPDALKLLRVEPEPVVQNQREPPRRRMCDHSAEQAKRPRPHQAAPGAPHPGRQPNRRHRFWCELRDLFRKRTHGRRVRVGDAVGFAGCRRPLREAGHDRGDVVDVNNARAARPVKPPERAVFSGEREQAIEEAVGLRSRAVDRGEPQDRVLVAKRDGTPLDVLFPPQFGASVRGARHARPRLVERTLGRAVAIQHCDRTGVDDSRALQRRGEPRQQVVGTGVVDAQFIFAGVRIDISGEVKHQIQRRNRAGTHPRIVQIAFDDLDAHPLQHVARTLFRVGWLRHDEAVDAVRSEAASRVRNQTAADEASAAGDQDVHRLAGDVTAHR